MNRPEFAREMQRLRGQIASLPPAAREALEQLAVETAERHAAISRAALRGHRAAEHLELSFEQLRTGCDRLASLARDALTQPRPPHAPGVN